MRPVTYESLSIGDVVVERDLLFTRDALVRYAGASHDFNPIHYRDDVAESVGLPGVLAHGMLTMGAASSPVLEWLGSAGHVVDYQSRFTRPIYVDGATGAHVHVTATVGKLDDDRREARIDLRVVFHDQTVLAKSQLLVAFAS